MKFEIDEYAHLNSPIHRWQPQLKLIGLTSLSFSFALIEHPSLIPFMVGTTILLYGLSRLPLSFWLSRIRYPSYFLMVIVALLPFSSGTTLIGQWGVLTLRQEGLLAALLVASRFLSIFTVGLVLFGTTRLLTTVKAMRSLGLSPILADMLLLSYRYLFEIAESLVQMQRSMRLRGFQSQRRFLPSLSDLKRLANLSGTLLVRSYEQSEQIYQAMRLRGYGNSAAIPRSKKKSDRWSRIGLAIALFVSVSFVVAEVFI